MEHADYDKVSAEGEGEAQNKVPEKSGVAFSIWLGILIDGVPESMLIGFMQSEGSRPSSPAVKQFNDALP